MEIQAISYNHAPVASEMVQRVNTVSETRATVRGYSGGHPKVMETCDLFLDQLEHLRSAGEMTPLQIERVLDGVRFSAEKHQYQKRKGKEDLPYIIHPIGVAHTLATLALVRDPDILIGALLHDTVEDTNTSFAEIGERFGPCVEGLVREVTDDKSLPKEERKRLQIVNAPHKSLGAALIKLSDKLYNLRSLLTDIPVGWSTERVDAYFDWSKQVIDGLPPVNGALKEAVDAEIASHQKK